MIILKNLLHYETLNVILELSKGGEFLNKRINTLRKSLGITMEEFGSKIGLNKSMVSRMEGGSAIPTDRTIKSICLVFNVNETWLRTGDGEMFVRPEPSLVERLCDEKGATQLERQLLEAYFEIDERVRGPFITQLMDGLRRRAELEHAAEVAPVLNAPPVTDADVEAQTEVFRQHLIREKNQASQASAVKESGVG